MSPVPPSERIAHLGTVDCWIYPPGRYETIAVTPPIIFCKGGSPKQATPLPRQTLPQHQEIVLTLVNGFDTGGGGVRLLLGIMPAMAKGEDRVTPCCQDRAARRLAGGSGRGVLRRDGIHCFPISRLAFGNQRIGGAGARYAGDPPCLIVSG